MENFRKSLLLKERLHTSAKLTKSLDFLNFEFQYFIFCYKENFVEHFNKVVIMPISELEPDLSQNQFTLFKQLVVWIVVALK